MLTLYGFNQLVGGDKRLLARCHVLERELAFLHFVLARYRYERNGFGVGVTHLFFHLRRVGEDFGTDACLACLCQDGEHVCGFCRSEVDEQELRACRSLFRIEVELVTPVRLSYRPPPLMLPICTSSAFTSKMAPV